MFIQDFAIENPVRCVAFTTNDSQVVVITSGTGNLPSNNKVYTFTRKNGLLLVNMLTNLLEYDRLH